jgi:CDP-diacylglycerol--glycerol-3-phosphate 3-phosphatidyltransferase
MALSNFSIYQLKPRFQQLLRPVLYSLARAGVTPNQVTLAAMLLSLAYGVALALAPGNLALWAGLAPLLLLRMALNAIDGLLAHHTGQKSRLGALLNEICDQVSDAALTLPFALAAGLVAPLVVVVALAALLVEFAGVLALQVGVPRRFDGPMGKSDRAFAFGLLAILLAAGAPPFWLNALLWLVLAGLAWTLANRLRAALRQDSPAAPPTQ